jgi:hypothetical protein
MTETSPNDMPADAIRDPDVSRCGPICSMFKGRKVLYQHNLELPDSYLEEVIIFLNEEI